MAAESQIAASTVRWKWSVTSSPAATSASSDGVTSVRQPSSVTWRGGRSGLQAAATTANTEVSASTGMSQAGTVAPSPALTCAASQTARSSTPKASSSQTALTRQPRSVSATTTITTSSTSPIGNASATAVLKALPVSAWIWAASSWVTIAAAPSVPIAASSISAGPNRGSRGRVNRKRRDACGGEEREQEPVGGRRERHPAVLAGEEHRSGRVRGQRDAERDPRAAVLPAPAGAREHGHRCDQYRHAREEDIHSPRIGPPQRDLTRWPPSRYEVDDCWARR